MPTRMKPRGRKVAMERRDEAALQKSTSEAEGDVAGQMQKVKDDPKSKSMSLAEGKGMQREIGYRNLES